MLLVMACGRERRARALFSRAYVRAEEKTGYLSIDDLRFIVTTDGNPLSGQDLEEFLAEADIFKNGVVVRGRGAGRGPRVGAGLTRVRSQDYKAFAELLLNEEH